MNTMKRKLLIFVFLFFFLLPVCLAGSFWFEEGSTIHVQVGEEIYNITMLDISISEDLCGLMIDNQTFWLKTDSSKRIDSLLITVFEATKVHSELKDKDICKVVISGRILETPKEEMAGEASNEIENLTLNETIEIANISNISEEIKKEPEEKEKSFLRKIWGWFKGLF